MEKLGDFLPEALKEIRRRCERNPDNKDFHSEHTKGVLAAIKGFMARKSDRVKRKAG